MLDLTSLYIKLEKTLNSRHFVTPPLVSPRNDRGEQAQKFHTYDTSLPMKSG